MVKIPTRYFSDVQERRIAVLTNGRVQSNSGGTKFGGGDVHTSKFLIEAKTPTKLKESFTIKLEWLQKMEEQAFEQGKECCALAFRFTPEAKRDFYVITEREFLEYLNWKESQNE